MHRRLLLVTVSLSALLVGLTPLESSAAPVVNTTSYQVIGQTQRIGQGALPGLRFVAKAPLTATVGQKIVVSTWWRDGRGRVYAETQDWGDVGIGASTPPTCEPGDRTYGGGSGHDRLTHAWNTPGRQTVTLTLTSGGCGIPRQERTVRFFVTVS